jgi:hypothetical protein
MPVASRLVLFAAVLLLGSLVLACGGDDDDDNSEPTRTRTATASRRSATPTATPGSDEKTPGPEESLAPTQGATAPPAAGQGTPAAEPPDAATYLAQFQGRSDLGEEGCAYDPSTRLTDCGVRGFYSVSPPLGGQDITCFITIVGGNPEFIRCTSAEPAETKWYDIQ